MELGAANKGILIILSMPKGAEFGIDMKTYEVGPEFKGIVGIPLGLHMISYGTGAGLRQGFFVSFTRPQEIVAKSWDPPNEELVEQGTGLDEPTMNNLLESLRRGQLASNLGPYPEEEQGRLWRNLTTCVDMRVLDHCGISLETRVLAGEWEEEKLAGATGARKWRRRRRRESGAAEGIEGSGESTLDVIPEEQQVVPFFPSLGRAARFVEVFGKRRPQGHDVDPSDVTRYNMDYSHRLEELLSTEYDGDWRLLMGEYQLAFVLFLNLFSMGALRFWKEATALLCGCDEALYKRPELFIGFVRVLFTQVKTIPEEFFEDEVSESNFLSPALGRLVRGVRDYGEMVPQELRDNVDRFAKLMQSRFKGLDFTSGAMVEDEEENQPIVVPLEEVERALAE